MACPSKKSENELKVLYFLMMVNRQTVGKLTG